MRKALVSTTALLGTLLTMALSAPTPARAEPPYPWCAYYGGSGDEGGTNCYFATERQCMEAISGNGGFCDVNPEFSMGRGPGVEQR